MCWPSHSPPARPPRCGPGWAALGVESVQARTFHAAALRQLRYFAGRLLNGRELPEVVDSKARLVTLAAARSGVRTDRTGARDLASEIEWAKAVSSSRTTPWVAAAKAGREPPHEPAKMAEVYAAMSSTGRSAGVIDFEDLPAARIEEHPDVADQVRAQYRHFVVDEYQDVNPAQQRLLDAWLGGREDLTVVGDASQTIYSFTGATSAYLVTFARDCRGGSGGTLIRLVRDYRSTPQVAALANQVIRLARGDEARLRLELVGQRPAGPGADGAGLLRRAGGGGRGGALRRASSRPARRRGRSRCCSGRTRNRRRTRRRWPRSVSPTWSGGGAVLRAGRGTPGDGRAACGDPGRH